MKKRYTLKTVMFVGLVGFLIALAIAFFVVRSLLDGWFQVW